jgi:hypothetical protein
MAKTTPDDLEAVRNVVATLEPFEEKDQERILRWAREKLGLTAEMPGSSSEPKKSERAAADGSTSGPPKATDIKTFIANKNPQSDIQFAAAVAYYYRFEAPEPQHKDAITAADLQEACRQVGRERLKSPAQTLVNAHNQGYLDKATRGNYVVNTVGENLVAMALGSSPSPRGSKSGKKK